jgi:hypothetical protein
MAVTVKRIAVWRSEVANHPGALAGVLKPFAEGGADLQVVMGYRYPGNEQKAAIEVFPVAGRKGVAAANAVGLSESSIPTLRVEGDNKPGLGHAIAQAVADAGMNLNFFVAQVIGRKYTAIIGFGSDEDAAKAATIIKKAVSVRKKK